MTSNKALAYKMMLLKLYLECQESIDLIRQVNQFFAFKVYTAKPHNYQLYFVNSLFKTFVLIDGILFLKRSTQRVMVARRDHLMVPLIGECLAVSLRTCGGGGRVGPRAAPPLHQRKNNEHLIGLFIAQCTYQ